MSTTTPLELCASLKDASSNRMIGLTGRILSISNSINMTHKECLATPLQLIRMMQSSTSYRHTTSKHLMVVRRHVASVTVPVVWALYKSSTKPTQTVWIKPARACSTQLPPQRTLSSMVLTSAMPLQRPLLQNKASTCAPTGPSTNGGRITKGDPPFQLDMLYLYCQLCKATLNHLACGRNTQMLYFVNLASRLWCMNHASIQARSMELESSLCIKLMTLLSRHRTNVLRTSFSTCWMTGSPCP